MEKNETWRFGHLPRYEVILGVAMLMITAFILFRIGRYDNTFNLLGMVVIGLAVFVLFLNRTTDILKQLYEKNPKNYSSVGLFLTITMSIIIFFSPGGLMNSWYFLAILPIASPFFIRNLKKYKNWKSLIAKIVIASVLISIAILYLLSLANWL